MGRSASTSPTHVSSLLRSTALLYGVAGCRMPVGAVMRQPTLGNVGSVAGDDELDGPEYRPPPAQDDRLWRHPSELAPRLRRSWAERHPLGVAAVAALSGALVTSAAWLFFASPSPSTVRIKEQVAMPPVIALQPRYVSLD